LAAAHANRPFPHFLLEYNVAVALASRKSPRSLNSTDTYFRDINETPLLSASDERQIATRVREGNVEARDHLVRANLRLVVNIARGFTSRGLPLPDLISEGNLGLLRAAETFDPGMNTRFSTYASYWIKQSIKRAVVNTGKTIRVPAYMVELMSKWRQAARKLQDELDRVPRNEEIAAYMRLPVKKMRMIQKAIRIYNATPQTEQPDAGWSVEEMIPDERAAAPDESLGRSDDLKQVMELINTMDQRTAAVLRMRFGLNNQEPKTLLEIGESLGLTRERVRQIELEALSKLNDKLTAA
jgi:RNA polymerase primary sigma factor